MRARNLWIFLVLALAAPVAVTPARATSFFEQPFPDSVKEAPIIVRGKVGGSYSDWGQGDSGKRIYTYWELQTMEVLKGDAPNGNIRMREMGGEKDGVGMQVAGTAHFNPGEDVVVFLGPKNTEGTYDVWGMMMGKYSVQKDPSGQEVITGPGVNSLTQGRISDGDEGRDDTRRSRWTLERLRKLIASQKSESPPKPQLTPVTAPSALASPEPSPIGSLAAPQLQPSSAENPSSQGVPGWAVGAGILGLIFAIRVLRRRK